MWLAIKSILDASAARGNPMANRASAAAFALAACTWARTESNECMGEGYGRDRGCGVAYVKEVLLGWGFGAIHGDIEVASIARGLECHEFVKRQELRIARSYGDS